MCKLLARLGLSAGFVMSLVTLSVMLGAVNPADAQASTNGTWFTSGAWGVCICGSGPCNPCSSTN